MPTLEAVLDRVLPSAGVRFQGDVIELTVGDRSRLRLRESRRAVVTPSTPAELIASHRPEELLVVADLVHSSAADQFLASGWSFWDRRGRLVLQSADPYISIDRPTPVLVPGVEGPDPLQPIAGHSGLAVALTHLFWPEDHPGVREIARRAGMAPSTISHTRARLQEHRLLGEDGRPLLPELFWSTSDAWAPRWYPLRVPPDDGRWVRSGDAVAAAWGAPTIAMGLRLYGLDAEQVTVHRLRGASDPSEAVCHIAPAPTPLVDAWPEAGPRDPDGWKLAHPVVAALDLSRDGRGREILDDWAEIALPGSEEIPGPRPRVVWR